MVVVLMMRALWRAVGCRGRGGALSVCGRGGRSALVVLFEAEWLGGGELRSGSVGGGRFLRR